MKQDAFKNMLKEKGLKVTKQRVMVLKALASCPGEHLTTEEIYDLLKHDFLEIGIATVYRTIQLLLNMGLINKISLDDGLTRYEIVQNDGRESGHHHHHLICKKCGTIVSFEDDLLENLEEYIYKTLKFTVINHEVKLFGYCKKCSETNQIK